MTTSAADQRTDRQLQELEDRTRTAWEDYRSSLADVGGGEYEELELISWERLQRELHELADERERLVGAAPAAQSAEN